MKILADLAKDFEQCHLIYCSLGSQLSFCTVHAGSESLLAGVLNIEEAVIVHVGGVELLDGAGHGDHHAPGAEQEEGLRLVEGQPVPDDGGQLGQGQLPGYQVLHFVNAGQRSLLKCSVRHKVGHVIKAF